MAEDRYHSEWSRTFAELLEAARNVVASQGGALSRKPHIGRLNHAIKQCDLAIKKADEECAAAFENVNQTLMKMGEGIVLATDSEGPER